MPNPKPRIAILGAGPLGLETALAAAEGGFPFTVYEAAPAVAAYVRAWGHIRLFSPWDLNVSPRMARALAASGQEVPSGGECPLGRELVSRVLEPLANHPLLAPHLRLDTRVVAVSRQGLLKHEEIGTGVRGAHPFRILLADASGREWTEQAEIVLDCTGSYGHPNPLGDGGIPAPGERSLEADIVRHIPDFPRDAQAWAGKTLLLAGAGHSAQTVARDLAEFAREAPGTRVLWTLRKENPTWGAVANDPLPERARLTAVAEELANGASPPIQALRGVAVEALSRRNGRIQVTLRRGGDAFQEIEVDRILSLTGYVGDHRLYRELQVHECYATCGPMKLAAALLGEGNTDCLAQKSHGVETLKNPEPGFFILGVKSYGRNNTFLLRTGWQQVEEVFGLLAATAPSSSPSHVSARRS